MGVGNIVRIRAAVETPKFGWGKVSPGEQGTVRAVELGKDGGKLRIDFPSQLNWGGHPSDVEAVPKSEVVAFDIRRATMRVASVRPPMPCVGHLWKQSPSMLRMWSYQHRYVEVRDLKLYWWRSQKEAHEAKFGKQEVFYRRDKAERAVENTQGGMIDLGLTPCKVQAADPKGSKLVFNIQPLRGKIWQGATFTGGDKSRVFTFDVTDSEHTLDEWIAAISKHIAYGAEHGPVI